MLNDLIIEYAKDTENPIKNYKLGLEYERLGQTAAAVSFFLRTCEKTTDNLLVYECLIRLGHCFDKQKNRNYTSKSMYMASIAVMPDRPEGYHFFSHRLEQEKSYFESYSLAEVGLSLLRKNQYNNLNINFPGERGFLYTKAVAGWWRGRNIECRELFKKLKEEYYYEMEEYQQKVIDDNITKLKIEFTPKQPKKTNKIVDYFTFYKPMKEMLRLRLHMYKDIVDEFVISEANKTYSGIPIDYDLENILKELNIPKSKIKIIRVGIPEDNDLDITEMDKSNAEPNERNINSVRARVRERLSFDSITSILDNYDDNAIFIVGDVDEFIDPKELPRIIDAVKSNENSIVRIPMISLEGRADLRVYNKVKNEPYEWEKTIVTTKKHLLRVSPTQVRWNKQHVFPIELLERNKETREMGWHFSSMGGKELIKQKYKSYGHYDDIVPTSFLACRLSNKEQLQYIDNLKLEEGESGPTGDRNRITRKYSVDNLPKEVFEIESVREFLFPKGDKKVIEDIVTVNYDKPKKKKIVDFFTFYAPLKEILRLRLHVLKDHVDEFIIAEANKTHSGMPIEYEAEKIIKEFNIPNLKYRVVKVVIPEENDLVITDMDRINAGENINNLNSLRARVRERTNIDSLLRVLDDYEDDTVFIISDADEIIKPKAVVYIADIVRQHLDFIIRIPMILLEGRADLRVYNKDTNKPEEWTGTVVTTKKHLLRATPAQMRSNALNPFKINYIAQNGCRVEDLGWHFSSMGGKEAIKKKYKAFSHYDDVLESTAISSKMSGKEHLEHIDNMKFEEGETGPTGVKNRIMKKFPTDQLPDEVFELPTVKEFLFPNGISLNSSRDDTKKQVEKTFPEYDSKYNIWGWCSLHKAGCFIDYIDEICQHVDNPVCVEIGVFAGKSALPVALELKRHNKGKLYAIDPWSNKEATKGYDGANYDYWNNINLNDKYSFFVKLVDDFGLKDFVNIIRDSSDNAPQIRNINFLHIDGQHTDQSIKDVNKFASQVDLNGYCIVDDVDWGSEISKVPNLLEDMGYVRIHQVDSALIFKRLYHKYHYVKPHDVAADGIPRLVSKTDKIVGIEVGVATGDSSEYLLRTLPNLTLYGIDPYIQYVDWGGNTIPDRDYCLEDITKRKLKEFIDQGRYIHYKEYSDDAVRHFKDETIDFIFIDGLHTYEQVLIDCHNYYPKLKKGGLLCGHDYVTIAAVRKAVNEFAEKTEKNISMTKNDVWYWFK